MATCMFYIDEGGNIDDHHIPIRNGESPLFCLAAIALQLDDWREFDREYLRLKRKFFQKEIDESGERAEIWEVKDLCQPRNRDSSRRHAFLSEVLVLCDRYQARTFGITFLKNAEAPTPPETLYALGLQCLAERFNAYINESAIFEHGILIADRRKHHFDFEAAKGYLSYVFGHETGKQLTKLQEAPLFADSRLTAGLQIAHHIASLLAGNHHHYYCRDIPGALDYSHLQRYWNRLGTHEFKSKGLYDEHQMFGYRVQDFSQRSP